MVQNRGHPLSGGGPQTGEFGHLLQGPVGGESRTVLKGPDFLQQAFLGMQADRPATTGLDLHTLRSQGTAVTDRTLKHKGLSRDPLPVLLAVVALAVETGATASHQVDVEVLLGKIRAPGWFGHLGDQGPFGPGELPASVAVPIGGIRFGHRAIEVALTLGHQRAPWASGALPGSTATAVISRLSTSTATDAL